MTKQHTSAGWITTNMSAEEITEWEERVRNDTLFAHPSRYQHGTRSAYVGLKCRCDECRSAESAYKREWMQRNPGKHNEYMRRYRAKKKADAAK